MNKRLLSLLLVVCMVLPLIPVMVIPATAANAGFTTSFVVDGENWPEITESGVTFQNNWKIGGMAGNADWNTNYYDATVVQGWDPSRNNSDCRAAGSSSQWMSQAKGAGFYTHWYSSRAGALIMAINYNKTPSDTGAESTLKNGDADMTANALVRYTAQATGTVTIHINELKFWADNNTKFAVLHNGERIGDFYGEDAAPFDYVGGDGWVVSYGNTADVSTDFGSITLDVTQGDYIDFVCRGNEAYQYGMEGFDYNKAKRGIYSYNFSVTYADGWNAYDVMDKWNSDAGVNVISSDKANKMSFYRWYDANDVGRQDYDTGIDGEGYYGKINPYLMQESTANILATDTLEQAFEKYCAYFKRTNMIDYSGNWSLAEINKEHTETSPIMYGGWHSMMNIYSVGVSTQGLVRVEICDKQAWVSEKQIDAMFADLWNDMVEFEKTNNVRTGTTAGDIRIKAVAEMSTLQCLAFHVGSGATLGSGDAMSNPFWLRPNNASGKAAGALVWTAPKDGVVTLDIENMQFVHDHGVTDFKYALMLNDAFLIEPTVIDAGSEDSVNAMKKAIAAKETQVAAGDELRLVIYRSDAGSCTRVKFKATAWMVESNDIATAATLEIDEKYNVNVYVTADAEATEAGVILNGVPVPGVLQADGTYKVVVKDDMNIADLVGYSASGICGTTVAYTPYEVVGGVRREGLQKETTTDAMLDYYINSDNTKAADLAEAVRALAIASRAAFDKTGTYTVDAATKEYLATAASDETMAALDGTWVAPDAGEYGYQIVGANVNYGNAVSLVFLVDGDFAALPATATVAVENGGEAVSVTSSEFMYISINSKEYRAITVDIPVSLYAGDLSIYVTDGTAQISPAISYNVETYCARTWGSDKLTADETLAYVIRGLYNLGVQAAAYKA